jgi:translation initiation factor IF-2
MNPRDAHLRILAAVLLITALVVSSSAAQQPGTADKSKQDADLARRLDEARKEAAQAKAEAEALRERLEKERQRALQAEQDARAQRDAAQQAEVEARQRADRARAEAEKALQEAEKIRRAEAGPGRQPAQHALAELALQRAALLEHFLRQRQRLEEEQQKALAELDRKAELLRKGEGRQGEVGKGTSDQGKLDQILERLERIEKRLDRLEKDLPKAQPKSAKGRK